MLLLKTFFIGGSGIAICKFAFGMRWRLNHELLILKVLFHHEQDLNGLAEGHFKELPVGCCARNRCPSRTV